MALLVYAKNFKGYIKLPGLDGPVSPTGRLYAPFGHVLTGTDVCSVISGQGIGWYYGC